MPDRFPHPPPADRIAIDELVAADPRLATVEALAGPLPWRLRPKGFAGLMQAITAQQISSAAASAIWSRLCAIPGSLTPGLLLLVPDEQLRAAGLSRPKIGHARALAAAFASGGLSVERLAGLGDDDAIAELVAMPGLGPWTAAVYLLFAHQRCDVFPAGDVALQGAAQALLGLPSRPHPEALRIVAEAWRPSRALAARLLWHHWRYLTGRPAMDDIGSTILSSDQT